VRKPWHGLKKAIAGIVLVGVIVGVAFFWKPLAGISVPTEKIWQAVSWRAQLSALKARGGVPDLSWVELWELTRPGNGFSLANVVMEGRSLEGSLTNPYVSDDDHKTGARIFRERCAACHGNDGAGWHGPPLTRSGFKHGDSDLAIYKVLRDGIANTPMISANLSLVERWQVVGYVKTLQIHGTGRDVDEASHLNIQVSSDQIRTAGNRPDEWLTYSGSLHGWRYTSLTEITPANVSQLRIRWIRQFDTNELIFESTPLVVNGIIFTSVPPSNVVALDAKSGDLIWRYDQSLPTDLPVCCGRANRGLAILDNALFLGSLDGNLVAINANNGKVIWQTQVAKPSDGYTITGAPLIVNRSVVVGVSGGEYGIRGFLVSYDAATGQQQWKFHTIPGPGDPGHETWENDAWRTGGGPTWVTGSYDPSLDLLYWGVGNPAPTFSGDVRPGDNLFTESVIALHTSSGKLAWHFQFTPHDEHDWDSNQTPVLADLLINREYHKVICWANRNGFYYVLDRVTGKFLVGTPFVEQNWAKGLDSAGRPILSDANQVSRTGRLTRPFVGGGTNWEPVAFDQGKGLIFVHATEGASVYTKSSQVRRGQGGIFVGSGAKTSEPPVLVVRALDITTGTRKWEHFSPRSKNDLSHSGLLATAGGLVFGGSGGFVFALDSATGQELWRVFVGGETRAPPISFTVDGRQVIAVSAGRALFVFGL
jgi:alcohol dehydrogenase (cytochrome c)